MMIASWHAGHCLRPHSYKMKDSAATFVPDSSSATLKSRSCSHPMAIGARLSFVPITVHVKKLRKTGSVNLI